MTLAGVSIETERLVLRPWTDADAPALFEMRSNPEITKWLGSPEPWRDLEQTTNEIAIWNRRNNADDPFGTWAMTLQSAPSEDAQTERSPSSSLLTPQTSQSQIAHEERSPRGAREPSVPSSSLLTPQTSQSQIAHEERSSRSDHVGLDGSRRKSEQPIGAVNLSRIRLGDEIEAGWYLHPDAVGKGYATEAAKAVIDHGLSNGVRRVWALMWKHNFASAKVARSAGMRDLGVLVDPWYGSEDDPYSQMFVAY